jgi:RNA polymerase sigma factor (sigma-70 family)
MGPAREAGPHAKRAESIMNAPIAAGDLAPQSSPRFEALYRDNYAFVWRCARRMCIDDGELEDVIQDVFVIAYRRIDSLAPGIAPSTWLFGIMRNVVRNRARGRGRHDRRLGAIAREVDASERHRQRLETVFAERVFASQMLLGFLRELDESQRAVFVLAELEGHSAKEIAAALAISPNTASSRLRLARRAFCVHFGLEPSRGGAHELTRPLREQPEQPEASVQNRSWGLLLAAVPKPGDGILTGGLFTATAGKVTAMLGAVSMAATLTVLVVQSEPRASSLTSSSPSSASASRPEPRPPLSSSDAGAPIPIDIMTDSAPDEASIAAVIVQAPHPRARAELPSPAEQLREARAALIAGDSSRTLELLAAIDEGDARLLGQRVATQVAALCKLGDVERARLVVEQLRQRDPTASVLVQLDRACW